MHIAEGKIQEVRERADLVALVQRHGVELKKSGRSFKGLCPFHGEKTPSFHVFPDGNRFKCFGCQAGGDAIAFVQRLLGKPFGETVRDLARELGIDLADVDDPAVLERQQLKDATDTAARFFAERLWDERAGRVARDYLHGRGVGDESARAFGLGWAPGGWTELTELLRERGLLGIGERAGLVAARGKGDGHFDVFRGRLMIPIRSPEGRVVAFGGRLLLGDDGPKYLNSRDSALYNKSEILYGVDQARDDVRRTKTAVLVEGYFDCIGLHQAGVRNAVALCSTALTAGHLALLGRLEARELVLLLDGDEAGRKAVERLAGAILAAGVAARVAVLPQGDDPDTFARRVGPEGVRELIGAARPLTIHLFRTVLPEGAAANFEAKMQAFERLRPVTSQLPVGLARSTFVATLARHTGLPAHELEAALRGKLVDARRPGPGSADERAPSDRDVPPDSLEAVYAASILRERRLLDGDRHRAVDELRHVGLRQLVAAVAGGRPVADAVYDSTPSVKAALVQGADQLPKDPEALEKAFAVVCRRIKLHAIEEQLRKMARETSRTPGASELTDEARELLEARAQLLKQKRELLAQK